MQNIRIFTNIYEYLCKIYVYLCKIDVYLLIFMNIYQLYMYIYLYLYIKALNSWTGRPPGEIPPQKVCVLYIYAYIQHIYAYIMHILPACPTKHLPALPNTCLHYQTPACPTRHIYIYIYIYIYPQFSRDPQTKQLLYLFKPSSICAKGLCIGIICVFVCFLFVFVCVFLILFILSYFHLCLSSHIYVYLYIFIYLFI